MLIFLAVPLPLINLCSYLHLGNWSYSSIDLTIEDPSLLSDLHWTVHGDLRGSDHFPIIV